MRNMERPLAAKLLNNHPGADSRAAADLEAKRIAFPASHFSQQRPFHASLDRSANQVVDYASLYKTKFHGFALSLLLRNKKK